MTNQSDSARHRASQLGAPALIALILAILAIGAVVLPTTAQASTARDEVALAADQGQRDIRTPNPALTAEANAQRSVWNAFALQNYSFSVEYVCFCPQNNLRILVSNGVASVIETPMFPSEGFEPQTIDQLFDQAQNALGNDSDTETITFHGTYGFPTDFLSTIDDPNVADGFGGYRISNFTDLDAVTADYEAGVAKWNQTKPYAYQFDYTRGCFCPPPFAPVTITVINDVVTDVTGSDIDPQFGFEGETIDELIGNAPNGSFGGVLGIDIDPAWGFPSYQFNDASVLGLADAFFNQTITNFVPLNIDRCHGMTPTKVGTSGNDILTGTPGVDVIMGLGGDDQIYGLGGNDFLCGGDGNDIIGGGDGDDYVAGDAGDDNVNGQAGNDTVEGGLGDDRLRGQAGNDRIAAGPGIDNASGSRDNDSVFGEAGDDFLRGSTGDDLVHGGPGTDFVSGNGGADMLYGGDGNDDLLGGPRPDMMFGGDGADLLRGLKGADTLVGGAGDDDLRGNEQPDSLNGSDGNDSCNGGPQIELLAAVLNCETVTNVP